MREPIAPSTPNVPGWQETSRIYSAVMTRRALAGVALLLFTLAGARPGAAQEPEAASSEASPETGAGPPAGDAAGADPEATGEAGLADAPVPEVDPATLDLGVSEAERVSRIRDAIESDRQKLADLRQDVVSGKRRYEELSREQKQLEDALETQKTVHEKRGPEGDPDERAALQLRIDALAREHELVKKKATLVFQALKTFREQIRALEGKIELDTRDMDRMTGVAQETQPVPATPSAAAPQPEEPARGGIPTLPHPAAGLLTGRPGAPPRSTSPRLPETAGQIEARMDAEKREREAFLAEQAVADFVDRKAALEEQIALERQLLDTGKEAEQALEDGLAGLQRTMSEMIAAGSSQRELRQVQSDIEANSAELDRVRTMIDERTDEVDHLQDRLMAAQADQLAISEEAARKRQEAEDARQRSIWLDSPFHPENVKRWALARGPRMFLVALAAGTMLLVVRFFTTRLTRVMVRTSRRRRGGAKRADTLAVSFRSAGSAIILLGGSLMMIEQAGVSVTTVLGGAAIFGVAIAFGAQNLMRDYFNGLVILVEDQYELNDLLTIGSITGRVERLNLRTTVLRDLEGRVHFIPNGEIKAVTNHTYEWARPVFDIAIAYKEDVDRVMRALLEVAEELRGDPEFKDAITEEPVMLGVDRFAESGPVIKFMMKTAPDQRFRVRREMLRRIKLRFDELGIEIPVPHRVIFQRAAEPSPADLARGVEES